MRKVFVAVVLSLAPVFAAQAASTFAEQLKEAEKVRTSDPKRFVEILNQLESRKAQATPLEAQQLRLFQALRIAAYKDRYDEGIDQAKALYKDVKDVDFKYKTGSMIASLSAIKRDFTTGLRYLERSMLLRSQVKSKTVRHEGVGAAAMLYNQMGQYSLGQKYAEEVLRDQPEPRMKCFASSFRLESLHALGLLPKGDEVFDTAIAACAAANEKMAMSTVRATLARKWATEGRIDKAIEMLEGAGMRDANATRYPRMIAEVRAILADLKLGKGDLKGAEIEANETIALGEEIGSTQALVTAYHTLYRIAERRGQPNEALSLYKRYAEADKARQSDVKARELAYEIVRHETQQKTQQIELLERKNQVLELRKRLDYESAQKAKLATMFLMLVLTGIIYWAVQVKRHVRQLKRLAQTDTLTGLSNRHYFTQCSERALVECARAGEPAALVMFDLDHFKAINDTYGHGAGDWVLKQVGKACAMHCRKIDYIGRIGGEEFAVLLRGLDLAGAARLAEDCRAQMAQIDTRESGYAFVVTASFGVSATANSGYDLSRLLSHADQMLYRAKNEGRNRVCAHTVDVAAGLDQKTAKRTPALTVISNA